jgi:hypothetical protein
MAVAKASASAGELPSAALARGIEATSFSMGSGTPMMPVEEGKTSSKTQPNSLAVAMQDC